MTEGQGPEQGPLLTRFLSAIIPNICPRCSFKPPLFSTIGVSVELGVSMQLGVSVEQAVSGCGFNTKKPTIVLGLSV